MRRKITKGREMINFKKDIMDREASMLIFRYVLNDMKKKRKKKREMNRLPRLE